MILPLADWMRSKRQRLEQAWQAAACRRGRHRFRTVAYGYPPHCVVWVTVQTCEHCQGWRHHSRDAMFAELRPESWALHEDAMNYTRPVPYGAAPWAPAKHVAHKDYGPATTAGKPLASRGRGQRSNPPVGHFP